MFNIVLIEDDSDESAFIRRAASRHPVQCCFTEFTTIRAALDFFSHESAIETDLVLLDMKVKRRSGGALARELKASPIFKTIPVVALSNSSAPEDQLEAWEAGCDGYFCKPETSEGYAFVMKSIMDYWFSPQNMARKNLLQRQVFESSNMEAGVEEQKQA